MEIPCVYIFDGPLKHMDLLEQLLDVSNNPRIRAEGDPGTARSKQTTSKRQTVQNQICYATLLLFFFSTVIKFHSPVKICHYLNRVHCLQLSHNCDNEKRQCADNQCP